MDKKLKELFEKYIEVFEYVAKNGGDIDDKEIIDKFPVLQGLGGQCPIHVYNKNKCDNCRYYGCDNYNPPT